MNAFAQPVESPAPQLLNRPRVPYDDECTEAQIRISIGRVRSGIAELESFADVFRIINWEANVALEHWSTDFDLWLFNMSRNLDYVLLGKGHVLTERDLCWCFPDTGVAALTSLENAIQSVTLHVYLLAP